MKKKTAIKRCFVIAPIGTPGSEARKRSDQVFSHVIAPAVRDCGYEPQRADEISAPGIITHQVIRRLIEDPLVVADLTGQNPNVLYELAVRHAIGSPCIQLIHPEETLPFDIAGMRAIPLDHRDLDSAAEARQQIKDQIEEIEASPETFLSPISMALEWKKLEESPNVPERALGLVLSVVDNATRAAMRESDAAPKRPGLETERLAPVADLRKLFQQLEEEEGSA